MEGGSLSFALLKRGGHSILSWSKWGVTHFLSYAKLIVFTFFFHVYLQIPLIRNKIPDYFNFIQASLFKTSVQPVAILIIVV